MDIKEYIQTSVKTKEQILNNEKFLNLIKESAKLIVKCYKNNGKVLIAGNGGSAGDAQHIATELVSKFLINRAGLSAFALTTDSSVLTSIGNDFGYKYVFSRQIEANGKKNDVFIGISTSGTSENIIEAAKAAKKQGLSVLGLTGEKASEMDSICDIIIKVPSSYTPVIQEVQMMICHIICAITEEQLFEGNKN